MLVFVTVAILLIAAALLFLLPPLIQGGAGRKALDRRQLNIMLYKDQLVELEADLKVGNITQDQFDLAHADLERSLLQDVGDDDEASAKPTGMISGNKAAIVVGFAIPVMAVLMYANLGSLERGLNPNEQRAGMTTEGHEGNLEEQIRKLQDHLQENPNDLEGWTMIARSYYFLKQYQAASDAFAKAVSMTKQQNPFLLADYADALAMANGRNMAGKPYELIKKALEVDPNHQKSLWLAATATYQAKDYKTTLDYWLTLRSQFPENSDNYIQMTRNIAEVKQFLGMPVDEEIQIVTAAEQAKGQEAVPGAQATTTTATSGAAPKVSGVVTLDPSLKDKVSASDTLFVFARAASGPRMPLAIIRTTVSDLPLEFTLDDSLAMNPQMKISKFRELIVGARVSKSGDAMPQSGDLSGSSDVVSLGTEGIKISINGQIP